MKGNSNENITYVIKEVHGSQVRGHKKNHLQECDTETTVMADHSEEESPQREKSRGPRQSFTAIIPYI